MIRPEKIIAELAARQDEALDLWAELDENGLFPGENEDKTAFINRCRNIFDFYRRMECELRENGAAVSAFGLKLRREARIPEEIMCEASAKTGKLYGFKINWAKGFFVTEKMGLLWGGSSWYDPQSGEMVFIVRPAFKYRKKWFIYRRDELLAHELCHVAHTPVADDKLEEFFAYQTSDSRFRRYLGNIFVRGMDAFIFIAPPFILLAVQMMNIFAGTGIAEWPFWALIGLVPAGFLIRNQRSRNLYFRAKTKLEQLKVKLPQAVLFRCTCREIAAIAAARSDGELRAWLIERIRSTQRFKIIGYRFLREIADETE